MTEAKSAAREMIAQRIREARIMAGLSQAQIAKLLGVHRPAVTEIEAGNRRVSAEELAQMANLLDVSVAWLVGETPDTVETGDPRVQLAARELQRLKPEDLDRLLRLLAAIRDEPEGRGGR